MERKIRTAPTSVKIPPNILQFVDKDVETSGEFSSRTDWIVAAMREFMARRIDILSKRKELFENDGPEKKG
ncbi:MAG: hypothetical protein E7Z70_06755 [Thermoplasmata archaeon]|nr:hypothetical protein [Thermoplasmata archaeon]